MQPTARENPDSRRGRPTLAALSASLLAVVSISALLTSGSFAADPPTPNVLMIVTDDQRYDELASMPNVRNLIAGQGVTFRRTYVTYPLCCPSRSSLLTGLYAHNHDVRGNSPPYGGWERFQDLHESNALPFEMQEAGYETGFSGKYMNGYLSKRPEPPAVPAGWDFWAAKTSMGNYLDFYYNYDLASSSAPSQTPTYDHYGFAPADYMTDVVGEKASSFLQGRSADASSPFFLAFWPGGPHFPFEPAPRHWGEWESEPLRKIPGTNEKDLSDKPNWLRKSVGTIPRRSLQRIDSERRRRLEQLVSVDEAIGALIDQLDQQGTLNDTYIFFTSDNGYFRGEHRVPAGKFLPYEPSARVPLIIRGPGIPRGERSSELTSLMDLPQTILEIATGAEDPTADGRSLLPYAEDPALRSTRPLLIEGFTDGDGPSESSLGRNPAAGLRGVSDLEQEPGGLQTDRYSGKENSPRKIWKVPAYRAIRTNRYLFVAYANGQEELYDMRIDPHQLENVTKNPRYDRVRTWLLAELSNYADCAGAGCRAETDREPTPLPPEKDAP